MIDNLTETPASQVLGKLKVKWICWNKNY